MPPKKKGVNVIVTGSTHKKMDVIDKTINGVKYTLFVPQRDCHNEMGKPYSKTINDIARREGYAQNGDEPDKWIAAIQKVFDNHYDEIKDVDGYKEFHQKKVYFLNPRAGERGFCTYIAVQRKPYKDQTGDAKKKPKRNKTRKKAPAKGKKGKVSEDGSGFIPAASTSAKKQKIMTKKEKAAKEVMGELYDSNDSDDDEGFDTIMRDIYDMKWNPKSEKYEKIPEQSLEVLGDFNSDLEKMAKSSSSESGSDPEGYSSSASSVLDYGSDASTDDDDLLDAFGNSTAYSIARTTPGTSAYYARMDKYDRRREKEEAFEERKKMKKELDDDLLEKVKKGMDVYEAHKTQTERWDRLREEEEMRAYEDQMTSEDESSESSESEEDRKRRMEILNLEYAIANGYSKHRNKDGSIFYKHNETGVTVSGNKDGLLDPKQALDAVVEARKQQNTMSSGTSSSTMSLPNVNTGAPKPWMQRTSRSTGKKYWWNPVTKISFWPKTEGKWTQKEADDAAERAKKKGGKKSRKKKKKTRRKKGGKRKKTKKRKLRKKRKTRR